MGNHIFDRGNNVTYNKDAAVGINRAKLIDFCYENHFVIANTLFEKPNYKLTTIKHPKAKPPYSFTRTDFDTVDYWLVAKQWKNSAKNCETDVKANINTDHFPLIINTECNLKARGEIKKIPRKNMENAVKNKKQLTTKTSGQTTSTHKRKR